MTIPANSDLPVAVVGGGIAGLAAARVLHERSVPFVLLEAQERLGGVIRTESRDGFLLDQPYYEDTVLVAPGQRVDVLIRASELGVWAFHCHVLSHAESDEGMFGMVTALIVTE